MNNTKLLVLRSFCSGPNCFWADKDWLGTSGTKTALLLLSALALSSPARGQAPVITTTALPYLLTNQGGVVIVSSYSVKPTPPAVGMGGFASYFGGGFSSLLPAYPATNGGAASMFALRHLTIVKSENFMNKFASDLKQDDLNYLDQLKKSPDFCANFTANSVRAMRSKARRMRNGHPLIASSATCELPAEEEAEEAEEALEVLSESQSATQDAIEAAETAAEAAEVGAEAAEAATEGVLEGIEILEAVLETCSLF